VKLFKRGKAENTRPLEAAGLYLTLLDLSTLSHHQLSRDDALRIGRKCGLERDEARDVLNQWVREKR